MLVLIFCVTVLYLFIKVSYLNLAAQNKYSCYTFMTAYGIDGNASRHYSAFVVHEETFILKRKNSSFACWFDVPTRCIEITFRSSLKHCQLARGP